MILLRICRRCEAIFHAKAQHIRVASTGTMTISKENDQVLKKLGFHQSEYKKVFPKKRTQRELNLQKIVDMLNVKLGFTSEEIRNQPNVLRLHPYLIDHRFKLLEESGIARRNITLERISKFPRIVTKAIEDLKKSGLLSQDTDVVHSILSFSNLPRELYPRSPADEESLQSAQTAALQAYISWKLNLSMEEVDKKYESYQDLHGKSIRLVMECYDILIRQVKLPEHKIKQNVYLFENHPDNILEILEGLPMIGNSTIQYVASANPKVLMRPLYKMTKVIDILKKYNIPDEGIALYSNVLTLSPDTVKERVASLYADPVFNPFFCSPRICFVISRYHTSISRYRFLSDMKWRCLTIGLLTTFQQDFQKRIDLGHDKSQGLELIHYIKRHLGYGPKVIRKQLRVHPFYTLLPLTAATETLQFLLTMGFSKPDIFSALPIILYPKEKVERWLQQVHTQPEVQQLRDEDSRLSPSVLLNLVLYYMERPYHFSGHGVWSEQDITDLPSTQ